MLQQLILVLDWFGVCVFAITGALVASRKEMDIVGFALLGSVTGIGGGTVRDVLLGVALFGVIGVFAGAFKLCHIVLSIKRAATCNGRVKQ